MTEHLLRRLSRGSVSEFNDEGFVRFRTCCATNSLGRTLTVLVVEALPSSALGRRGSHQTLAVDQLLTVSVFTIVNEKRFPKPFIVPRCRWHRLRIWIWEHGAFSATALSTPCRTRAWPPCSARLRSRPAILDPGAGESQLKGQIEKTLKAAQAKLDAAVGTSRRLNK
jgi:hypothetical protein